MNLSSLFSSPDTFSSEQVRQIAVQQREEKYRRTDRMFARLLAVEYVVGIATAVWISPLAWAGSHSQVHPHVWSATLLGAVIVSLPILLVWISPGQTLTRHVIAIAQLLMSGLLIHLTQGRIETHFHVFGSLAFLAFYRDWRVLITASAVTAVDHLIRGYAWPLSIYGVELQSHWRWLEHTGWVLFEDLFLILACQTSIRETNAIAERQSELEATNQALRRERTLLEAIHAAQSQFINAEAPLAVFNDFLKHLLDLSESEYGLIDELFYDSAGKPLLTARAISDIAWNEESREMYQHFLDGTLNFTNLKSLYGEVLTTGEPLIANDALRDPRRAGTPAGHPPLKAFLGLPLLSSTHDFVGVIGLANRPGGYTPELITYLQPMVLACANLIAARKNDVRRKEVEQKLLQAHNELEERVRVRTAELERANQALQAEVGERERAEHILRQNTDELERFNRQMVGREERMIELKREVNIQAKKLGYPEPYDLSFLEQEPGPS